MKVHITLICFFFLTSCEVTKQDQNQHAPPAASPAPNRTLQPSVPSASTSMTKQTSSSSLASSKPSSASSEAPAAGPATGALLYVGLSVLVMIIMLSAAVLIFCRKRTSKPKEPPVESEYTTVTNPDRVYEEIREEDRQGRSPSVEISTVYTYGKYATPNGVETTGDYSFITAASSQKTTEDDSNKLTDFQVDFSNGSAASLNSAPPGHADNVVYSVPQVEASSDGINAEDASPPLYSSLHQQ